MSQRSSAARLLLVFVISLVLIIIVSLGAATLTAVRFGTKAVNMLTTFAQASQTSPGNLLTIGAVGWNTTPAQTAGRKNILILGLDSLATRGDATPLTDTIILASLDLKTGSIKAVSFPRDLWLPEYGTRINALYWYGMQKDPQQPEIFPQQIVSEITEIPIHHTVVVSLEELGQAIDLIGGITIDVKNGFVDPEFPRTDVDVTVERDPAKLYEKIEFKPGVQTMDGQTALKYIRSRHAQSDEGNDHARSARQQQVIEALMKQSFKPELIREPAKLGELYLFYKTHFADDFPTTEVIATGHVLLPKLKELSFSGSSPSIFPEEAEGVLFHPPLTMYQGQWVYVIKDLERFKGEVKTKLNWEAS